jgi:hypothetical protein
MPLLSTLSSRGLTNLGINNSAPGTPLPGPAQYVLHGNRFRVSSNGTSWTENSFWNTDNFTSGPYGSSETFFKIGTGWLGFYQADAATRMARTTGTLTSATRWTTFNPGMPTGAYLTGAYNGSRLVIPNFNSGNIVYSDNAMVSHTSVTIVDGAAMEKRAVAFGNDRWVIVGGSGSSRETLVSTTNAASWTYTAVSLPVNDAWKFLIYANNRFLAIGYNRSATSTNGTTWSPGVMPTLTPGWFRPAFGNGIFVAPGNGEQGAQHNLVAISSDGLNWTQQTLPATKSWTSIVFDGSKFILATAGNNPNQVTTSVDGITWTTPVTYETVGFGPQWVKYFPDSYNGPAADFRIADLAAWGINLNPATERLSSLDGISRAITSVGRISNLSGNDNFRDNEFSPQPLIIPATGFLQTSSWAGSARGFSLTNISPLSQ